MSKCLALGFLGKEVGHAIKNKTKLIKQPNNLLN